MDEHLKLIEYLGLLTSEVAYDHWKNGPLDLSHIKDWDSFQTLHDLMNEIAEK